MRTTLSIDDDAVAIARQLARRRRIPLGQAVSELVRKGARQPLVTRERNGFVVAVLPESSPRVTTVRVCELADELP